MSRPIKCSNCTISISQKESFVLLSFFYDFKNSAIKYTSNDIKVLHSKCNFNNNTSTSNGGSVYFNCKSSFVQYKICSLSSQTTISDSSGGHHSFSNCRDSNNLNFIYDSSIYLCGNDKTRKTVVEFYGNTSIRSTNFSKCTAEYQSSYCLYPSTEASVSFCTMENSTCKQSEVLGHFNYKTHYLSYCNILNNEVAGKDQGIISCNGIITIKNCSIFGNKGPSEFRVFYKWGSPSASITVKNCNVQSSPSIPNDISTDNIKIEEIYLNLTLFSASHCDERIYIEIYNETFDHDYIKLIRFLAATLSSCLWTDCLATDEDIPRVSPS